MAQWLAIAPVLCSLLGGALLIVLRQLPQWQWRLALLLVGAVVLLDAALLDQVWRNGPLAVTMGNWLPPFGITFAADLVGAGFALVAALVTLVVLVQIEAEATGPARANGLYPLVLLLLAGVSGSFLTGDLFNLYVWFEVMLIASFGLMALRGEARNIDGTLKYGVLNFLATSFFLLALGLIYGLLGTLNMADIAFVAPRANPDVLLGIAAVLLLAFAMKAAAFPVNAWLPASYHTAPAGPSALMAGLLTKVGAYALLRTLVVLLPASGAALGGVLGAAAAATLVVGPLCAIAETNLRRAMGFLLIGGIGAILAGIALTGEDGVGGAVAYTIHAMFTVTGLYVLSGLIEKLSRTNDTRKMGGLYAAQPLLAALFFLLVLAIAGVPPFLGFWPKLLLLRAGLGGGDLLGTTLAVALLLNALLTLIAGTRLWAHVFWRERDGGELLPMSRRDRLMVLVPAGALTGLGLLLGLLPETIVGYSLRAATGLLDPAAYIAAVGLGGAP